MKHLKFFAAALATLLLAAPGMRAQDDEFPELADHGVPLQQVIKEWHNVGLYTAGWDRPATIRNYFVGLANAFPNELFQMIVGKMLGLGVDDALFNYVLDVPSGYVSAELGTETSPAVQMCYWRCPGDVRLVGVALTGHEYNMEEPDPAWTDEEQEEHIFVNLNDIAFFRIRGDEAVWRPVPVREVCGQDIDFKEYDRIELPRQGKDIKLVRIDFETDRTTTVTLKWNGNGGFTLSK